MSLKKGPNLLKISIPTNFYGTFQIVEQRFSLLTLMDEKKSNFGTELHYIQNHKDSKLGSLSLDYICIAIISV